MTRGLDRRQFIAALLASAGAAACSNSNGAATGSGTGSSTGAPRSTAGVSTATAAPPPTLSGAPFTLGVASGDPLHDRVILWTRLAPEPLAGGGMPAQDVDVEWEVSGSESFADLVQRGVATATPGLGHSLHVDAAGLEPDTWYYYRFRVGEHVSPVGRTRTFPAPDASPERMRLAVATCQDYQTGEYGAYRDMAKLDLDAVLFLGDYIYEAPGAEDAATALAERRYLGGFPVTVDDFRSRYAITQMDAHLRAAHERFPWIITFDDHEVINNYAGDDGALAGQGPEFLERRAAAYQAWYEHLPLRIEPPVDGNVTVHRDLSFGDLARLFVIETRQHADSPPCRDTSLVDMGPACEEMEEPDRTILGDAQEEWLIPAMAENAAFWQILANPVIIAGLNIAAAGEPPAHFLETWDGYPVERRRVVQAIADRKVRNPVVLTGDYHASFVNEVKVDPWDAASPMVAPELLVTSISSPLFAKDYSENNPQVRYFEAQHGYLTCDITREAITAEFRYIADATDEASPVTTGATFRVTPASGEGSPAVTRV